MRFHNNEILTEKKLKKQLKEIKEDRWWRGADFDPKKYEEDKEKIILYCQKEGFRDARILRDSLSYNDDKDALFIDIWIEEGTQYYFGDVKFDGNTIFTDEELQREVLFTKGDIYDLEDFEKTINEKIKSKYYNEGYLFAQIQPVETPRGIDTVDIAFNITESKVVRINQIRITGNSRTNEKVVRRELTILPGDIFNQSKIERSMQEVWMLNYFANVMPDVKFIQGNDDFVDLEFAVEEKSTDQANASIGYSAYEGPIGNLGFSFTNFSIRRPFQIGDGQRLSFQWYFGKYYKSFSLSFTEPWMFNTPTLGGFSIFNKESGGGGLYTFKMRERGGSITLGREFKWPDNFFRGQWTMRFADINVEGMENSSYSYYYGNRNSQQMSFSQVIYRDSRNRPEFPTAGSVNSVLMKLAGGPLRGSEDFLKFRITSEWYIPTYKGLVFYLNNQLGFLHAIKSGSYINPGEKFFIGGSGMGFAEGLRGYPERFTAPNGGLALGKFTTELRFPIAPNPTIFGLFFVEGGNVWDNFSSTDLFDLYRSVGAGIRLFMPMVGIIGVDFGYGMDRREGLIPTNKGKWEIHFQFGKF
ncbi:MAG: outer membrane protein assembly factor BamA [Calditrichia bacterium]|nr:outer membrane protein assembly factor BamA [Calditrichia bacterium]